MFDRLVVLPGKTRTEYVTREVHEHRAPTDESVKLLREMEAAADAKRIASFKLDANNLKGVIEVWHEQHNYRVCARAVFDINGSRHTATADIQPSSDGFHKVELMQALHAKIAETVASIVLGEGMAKMGSW